MVTPAVAPGDLLCSPPGGQGSAGQRNSDPGQSPPSLVYLRLETATASETKVAGGVLSVVSFISLFILVALIVCKTVYAHSLEIFRTVTYEVVSLVLATLCLVVLSTRFSLFIHRVASSIRRGQQWLPRRQRIASLTAFGACVQLVNIICWMVPSIYVIAKFPGCQWFSMLVNICGSIRWMCWNTTLLLYLISGSSLQAWNPGSDLLRDVLPQTRVNQQVEFLLVLDAPLWHHWNKMPLWLGWTFGVIAPIVAGYNGRVNFAAPETRGLSPEQCRDWDWGPVCVGQGWSKITYNVIVGLSAIYFLWYLLAMARVHLQLSRQPFAAFRAANILFQLQLRSMLLTYKVLIVCICVLWFLKQNSCLSYITTWLGMIPMQLVATALAWHNLFLFMVKDPESDPVLQVWLQEVAWTEAEMPQQLAKRNARAEGRREQAQLQQEPMFCYETALKLLKFSSLTYTNLGQALPAPCSHKDCGQHWCSADEQPAGSSSSWCSKRLHASCRWRSPLDGTASTISANEGSTPSPGDLQSMYDDPGAESGEDSPSHLGSSTSLPDSEFTSFETSTQRSSTGTDDIPDDLPEVVVTKHDLRRPRARRKKESTQELFAIAMALYDLTDILPFYDPVLDVKALLAWNRKRIVLAFRGTASMTNAWSDLQVWRTAHHRAGPGALVKRTALVHTGFYRAWVANGLHEQVIKHLQELYKSGAVDTEAHICVTGHSLGGALAVLAAHDVAAELKPASLQCYTFGCPYVGNHSFARQCEATVRDMWHVVHDRDMVTRSGKFLFLFKRPGYRVHIDLRGEMLVRPSALELQLRRGHNMKHHWLRAYRSALVAVLLAQFSNRGNLGQMSRVLQLRDSDCTRQDLAKDGVDWQKLMRATRWGSVAASNFPAPKACYVCRLIGPTCRAHSAPVSSNHLREEQGPGISVASLQHVRSQVSNEGQSISLASDLPAEPCCTEGDSK